MYWGWLYLDVGFAAVGFVYDVRTSKPVRYAKL
jgi:hypothetical protein